MPMFKFNLLAALTVLACGAAAAHATPHEDLAFAVQESNHVKTSGWVIEKLVTYQLGAKCWAKLADKKYDAASRIAGHARYIERYAKVITGDDWSHIEDQGANNKEANRAIVENMIEEFKPKFHLTVVVEGDDCEPSGRGLWIKYATSVTLALEKYPPKSGKAFVTVTASAKAKVLTAEVARDGATITIVGPRDIEPVGWSDVIERSLKRVSTKN